MAAAKKYNLDGKFYKIRDIAKITKLKIGCVRLRLSEGASSIDEIKKKRDKKNGVNWQDSMMKDDLGHWTLINKALNNDNK